MDYFGYICHWKTNTKMRKLISTAMIALMMVSTATAANDNKVYQFDKPLYGAAYYSEYTPTDRLDEDIRLMKQAGLAQWVRVGESRESLYEPAGRRVPFRMDGQNIGQTPCGGHQRSSSARPLFHSVMIGGRTSRSALCRPSTAGRAITASVRIWTWQNPLPPLLRGASSWDDGHFLIIPPSSVIRWTNEVGSTGIDNQDYFEGFRDFIKTSFPTTISTRWTAVGDWTIGAWISTNGRDFYDRKGRDQSLLQTLVGSWNRKVTADFLNWQVDIVNEYKRPWPVCDSFPSCLPSGSIDQVEAFRQMGISAISNITMQDAQDGMWIGYASDHMRPICKRHNFLVTETNAQGTGWSSRDQFLPTMDSCAKYVSPSLLVVPTWWSIGIGRRCIMVRKLIMARHSGARWTVQPYVCGI